MLHPVDEEDISLVRSKSRTCLLITTMIFGIAILVFVIIACNWKNQAYPSPCHKVNCTLLLFDNYLLFVKPPPEFNSGDRLFPSYCICNGIATTDLSCCDSECAPAGTEGIEHDDSEKTCAWIWNYPWIFSRNMTCNDINTMIPCYVSDYTGPERECYTNPDTIYAWSTSKFSFVFFGIVILSSALTGFIAYIVLLMYNILD